MLSKLRKYFLTGLVVLLPIVFTLLILQYILRVADAWIVNPLYRALPFEVDKTTAVVSIKIVLSLLVFLFICLIGLGTEIFVIKKFFTVGEKILSRVPMVNPIYTTLKEVMHALVGEKKELFRSAVLVQYPRLGIYTMGFVTKSSNVELKERTGKELVSIFIPTTPNPTSGVLIFAPRDELIELPFTIEAAIKLLVSGGTVASGRVRI